MRGQDEGLRQGVCHEDFEQVGDAEEGGNGLFPGGKGRFGFRRSALDHALALRISSKVSILRNLLLFS